MEELVRYLKSQYEGVFDEAQLHRFMADYVDLAPAKRQVDWVEQIAGGAGRRWLDIGCGFGSFVLAARMRGFQAVGVDIAPFEIDFARRRLEKECPQDDPNAVYLLADGSDLPFEEGIFDVITLWNVLEHVPDAENVLLEAYRVLRPGGCLFVVCPNYMAFRREAHYQVPWLPLMPQVLAIRYLRLLGKDPRFLSEGIFYRTNWGLLRTLKRMGMTVHDVRVAKLAKPAAIKNAKLRRIVITLHRLRLSWAIRLWFGFTFYNPLRPTIEFYAVKRA